MRLAPFDVCIVGAGILGASCADEIAREFPEYSIGIFDRSMPGSGASWYSVGLSVPFSANQNFSQFCPSDVLSSYSNFDADHIRALRAFVISAKSRSELIENFLAGALSPASAKEQGDVAKLLGRPANLDIQETWRVAATFQG